MNSKLSGLLQVYSTCNTIC